MSGYYYVTVIRPARRGQRPREKEVRCVAGPWPTHEEALGRVRPVAAWAGSYDPMSSFYEWGTTRSEADLSLPLNPYQKQCEHDWKLWPHSTTDYCLLCGEGRA